MRHGKLIEGPSSEKKGRTVTTDSFFFMFIWILCTPSSVNHSLTVGSVKRVPCRCAWLARGRAYLKRVRKEVVVEHRPVLATNIHDDFAQFVSDEIGHRLLLSEEQFGQTAANLHLVLRSNADPHLVHQVLEERNAGGGKNWTG